jgi:hypothetical protein
MSDFARIGVVDVVSFGLINIASRKSEFGRRTPCANGAQQPDRSI